MGKEILICSVCSDYTMKREHCCKKTIAIKPAKYSPEDKYGKYRRKFKEQNG